MNYYNYIDSLEPNENLRSKIQFAVKSEINHKNVSVKKKKTAFLSTAACFIFVAASAFASRITSNSPQPVKEDIGMTEIAPDNHEVPDIANDNDFADTSQTANSSANVQINEPSVSVQTSANENNHITEVYTSSVSQGERIKINTQNDGSKYGAQKIIINGRVYVQYCSSNKSGWGEDNGNITINKSDIGKQLCMLKAKNLIDLEHWYDYSTMTSTQAKACSFNKAEVFELKNCKNSTVLLAKAKDDYYIFTLSDLMQKTSASDIIDIYTADGENPIKRIDVIENTADALGTKASKKIKDKDTIEAVLSTVMGCKKNNTLNEIISNKALKDDYERYTLILLFEDDTKLSVSVCEHYFFFSIRQQREYGYYELTKNDYNSILSCID